MVRIVRASLRCASPLPAKCMWVAPSITPSHLQPGGRLAKGSVRVSQERPPSSLSRVPVSSRVGLRTSDQASAGKIDPLPCGDSAM